MIVADASVVVAALVNAGPAGTHARARLGEDRPWAPELVALEVASSLRRLAADGVLHPGSAVSALRDLVALPLVLCPHRPLIPRAWELRDNLTVYDAAYVALAELLGATLFTADRRLASAPGIRCEVEVLE